MKRDWRTIPTILCDIKKLPVERYQPYDLSEDGDEIHRPRPDARPRGLHRRLDHRHISQS